MSIDAGNRWDHGTVSVMLLAACVSAVAFLSYFQKSDILLYGDAVAHINIARRVFDSRTPGLLQLGTVWLPLPHLLMIPFVISNRLWMTGAGPSLPSMVAYVLGVVGIFRLVRGAIGSIAGESSASLSAAFAAAIYGLNPNLLYLQSTAMTESLYLALFIWAVVFLNEFLQERGKPDRYTEASPLLRKCGLCQAAACLVRYDGWFLAALMCGIAVLVAARAHSRLLWRATCISVLLAAVAPAFWLGYNAAVYRNPLEFANGPYSARAIERKNAVPGSRPHPGSRNLPVAALYFGKAAEFSVAEGTWQQAWLAVALLGSVLLLWFGRRNAALLLLWTPVPFYMISIAYGGVPIFTPAWWPFSLYNIRYGVQLLPAFAVFLALAVHYPASRVRTTLAKRTIAALGLALIAVSYGTVWRAQPACFREAWVNSRTRIQLERTLAQKLKELPPHATILMYLGEHVGALQDAGIPLSRTINEGNHRVWKEPVDPNGLWEQALADPAKYTDFVLAFEGDAVWQAVHHRDLPEVAVIGVNGHRAAILYRSR